MKYNPQMLCPKCYAYIRKSLNSSMVKKKEKIDKEKTNGDIIAFHFLYFASHHMYACT